MNSLYAMKVCVVAALARGGGGDVQAEAWCFSNWQLQNGTQKLAEAVRVPFLDTI